MPASAEDHYKMRLSYCIARAAGKHGRGRSSSCSNRRGRRRDVAARPVPAANPVWWWRQVGARIAWARRQRKDLRSASSCQTSPGRSGRDSLTRGVGLPCCVLMPCLPAALVLCAGVTGRIPVTFPTPTMRAAAKTFRCRCPPTLSNPRASK
jgi:hypothetical protein